jgi:1-pyrroline-5-carboxylate dehydrogenase
MQREANGVAGSRTSVEGRYLPPPPVNEPVLSYAPNSPERRALKGALEKMAGEVIEIPLIIGGKEVRTGRTFEITMPHDHGHVLARCHEAGPEEAKAAVEAAREAWREWSHWSWDDRVAVFLRAAELLAGPWRATLNAATMLGQGKSAYQAEIDSACELIDFWRFNCHFATQVYAEQPISSPGVWNRMDYRPLEGFVYAVTPFNFTAIGGNLPTAPALMGNVAIWKPAHTAALSNYYIMRVLEAAGLPPGVINFLPGDARAISGVLLQHPEFAGLHFTGSTETFAPTAPTRASWGRRGGRTSSWRTRARSRRRSPRRSCAAASSTRGRSAARPRASMCRAISGMTCGSACSPC